MKTTFFYASKLLGRIIHDLQERVTYYVFVLLHLLASKLNFPLMVLFENWI